jgi:PAS domain S-box-containing protein
MISNRALVNVKHYEMIGYTPEEIDFDFAFFLKTIHLEDVASVEKQITDYLEGKTTGYEAHYRMVTKSGKIKDVMGRGKIVSYGDDGRPFKMAGVITDVTEMKRLGEEVNRINKLESIGLLAGGLAHDFNNVLNVIYGNISFAKMLAGGGSIVVAPLTDAEEACEHARELGQRLRAFAQGNAPVKEAIALPAIIEHVAATLFKGANILHAISAADDILPLEADPRQIRQVFENLLTNARDAMADGGTVKIGVENYLVEGKKGLPIESGNYVRMTIKDNGRGIPGENLPKIFDPYFSTKDTYSQKGLGLGLSICHAILKRHNGHIVVESPGRVGTLVTIYLPASH